MKAIEPGSTHPGKTIRIDEAAGHSQIDQLVRDSVEEPLNNLLDAEADRQTGAVRKWRADARKGAGSYQLKLPTRSGEVTLNVPTLRNRSLQTAIIACHRRRLESHRSWSAT